MARTKSPSARKHRVVLKKARGYRQAGSKRFKSAKEALLHAGKYAYIGRKQKKRNFRKLWITRISAASAQRGTSYSKLTNSLRKSKIELDRKILAEIAVTDPETFDKIHQKASHGQGNNQS